MANLLLSTMGGRSNAMYEITVRSSQGNYGISLGLSLLSSLPASSVTVLDPAVAASLPPALGHRIEVVGEESSKTLLGCESVIIAFQNCGVRRGDTVVAIGGGVIQDVATLSTSLYMRGIDWTYVPTTLMSMIDSCIGGKSSINAGGIKNLVGNFHPPQSIIIDPIFIATLPPEAIASGLAEAVKICFARGSEAFLAFVEDPTSRNPGPDENTAALIHHALRSKQWFVEIDEFDKAERQLLNFGHSFGHAWESSVGFSVQHGIGVAIGMLAALAHPASAQTPLTAQLRSYCHHILTPVRGPIRAASSRTDWSQFREALAADKKNSKDFLRLILPALKGSVEFHDVPLTESELRIAEAALKTALEGVLS
jgi:3-dehydroquinate synthase